MSEKEFKDIKDIGNNNGEINLVEKNQKNKADLKKVIPILIILFSLAAIFVLIYYHEKSRNEELEAYKQLVRESVSNNQVSERPTQYVIKKKMPETTPTPTPKPTPEPQIIYPKPPEDTDSEEIDDILQDMPEESDDFISEETQDEDTQDTGYGPIQEDYYLIYDREEKKNHPGYVNLYCAPNSTRLVRTDDDLAPIIVDYGDYVNIWNYYTNGIDDEAARLPYTDANTNYIIYVRYSTSDDTKPGIKYINVVDREGEYNFYVQETYDTNETPHGSGYIVAVPIDAEVGTPVNLIVDR